MLRIAVRGVRAHLVKFMLSVLAVALGVAFVTGTLSLREMLGSTFDDIVATSTQADAYIAAGESQTGPDSRAAVAQGLPVSIVDDIAARDGVRAAVPEFQGSATLIGADGTAVRTGQGPSYAIAFDPNGSSGTTILGEEPEGDDEILLEASVLEISGFEIGDKTDLLVGEGLRPVTIVGSVDWGGATAGATLMFISQDFAEASFGGDGLTQSIAIYAEPGVTEDELVAAVDGIAEPYGATAQTGTERREEASAAVAESLGFISTFLMVFAGLALFVGGFIIANTFTMTVRERLREFAMLRAVGASPGQVFASVVIQAAVVGLIGSVLGIAGGMGLLALLRMAFGSMGMTLGAVTSLTTGTVLVGVLVGTVVTVVASVLPARRAALIPPVEAMRDEFTTANQSLRIAASIGTALVTAGAGAVWWATANPGYDQVDLILGLGAGGVLLGVLAIGPVLAPGLVRILAMPFVWLIRPLGKLAQGNLVRNPRRTANTAGALTIGMALVGGASVIAASTQASVASIVATEVNTDFVLTSDGVQNIPVGILDDIKQIEYVDDVEPLSASMALVAATEPTDTDGAVIFGLDPDVFGTVLLPQEQSTDPTAVLARGEAMVDQDLAEDKGWTVGETLTIVTASGRDTVKIGGTLNLQTLSGGVVIPEEQLDALVPAVQQILTTVLVTGDPEHLTDVHDGLVNAAKPYIIVSVQDSESYVDSAADQINQILTILNALLGLSLLVAGLGIVNTLALSVIERTREIGLLRAVGLGRLQLSTTVMFESVLTSVTGTAIGLAVGVGLASTLPTVYAADGFTDLVIPWNNLAGIMGVAIALGVTAAVWPGARAARLKVLDAISYE